MTQAQVAGHFRAAQIEIAIGQAQILVGYALINRERQRFGLVEDFDFIGHDFDSPGGEPGILRSGQTRSHLAGDFNHILAPQVVRTGRHIGMFFRPENNLGNSLPIAEVNKDHAAMVPAGIDPAAKAGS